MKGLFILFISIINNALFTNADSTSNIFKPVYIALPQNNIPILKQYLADVSDPLSTNYRQWLPRESINKLVHPPVELQNRVLDWISDYPVLNLTNNGDSITFLADPTIVYEMFKIHNDSQIHNYVIPNDLHGAIEFVEMNSNRISKNLKKNVKGFQTDDRFFSRESSYRLYNITNTSLNGTISGGLIEYQNNAGFTNCDLNLQQMANNQNANNITNIVGNNYGTDDESELDIQMLSQTADGINLWYWNSPYWLYSFAVDFYNAEDIPEVISMSWGWAEDSQCNIIDCNNITSRQYVERVNNEYLKISLRGTTILVSSGDAGAPGRTDEECDPDRAINPVFPGSSPYVLSIGATFVPLDNSTSNYSSPLCQNNGCITSRDERSISYEHVGWTAGGGFDLYHNETPYWQRKAVAHYLENTTCLPNSSNFNINGRAYPDVSAIGHSCPTYINGELDKVDGTSCSSPAVAGLIAIINHYEWVRNRQRVGYINPLLYYIHEHCPSCFNDVLIGHNWCTENSCCDNPTQYGFQATFGYDPVTGLGTLNVGNILEFLDTLFS